ncbi:MAG TPA: O-antigen ligase family protein [Aggregatilineales bacterium]|nr:O-antigen ligase family protein [Aggregatilineales bacterium]
MLLFRLQILLVAATLFLSGITGPRLTVYLASQQANIPLEFRGILLSLPDLTLIVLLLVTAARLVTEADYRARLLEFVQWAGRGAGKWWVLLLGWMLIGVLFALNGAVALYSSLHLGMALALALILGDLFLQHERIRLVVVGTLIAGGVFQAGIALLQAVNGNALGLGVLGEVEPATSAATSFYRAPGLTSSPNHLGGYLLIALAIGALTQYGFRNTRWRIPLIGIIGLLLAGIVTTLSRSTALGVLAWALSVLPFVWTSLPYIVRRNLISGAMLTILLGSAWATALLAADPTNIYQRTFAPRDFFFVETWPLIQENPILGVGAGNLMLEVGARTVDQTLLQPVRNAWLYIWAESGLPGVLLFFMGCWALLRGRNRSSGYSLVFTGALLGICVIALFDHYFWAVHPLRVYFFGLVGLCLGSQLLPASDWSAVNLDEGDA